MRCSSCCCQRSANFEVKVIYVMDADAIRQEIDYLNQEIADIKRDLDLVQSESARVALSRGLQEKISQLANLHQQVNITIGDDNTFSSGNMSIGSQAGRDIIQNNETNSVDISGTFGDNNYIASRDIHIIYPDVNTFKNVVPIDISISCYANISKRLETSSHALGIWKFKKSYTHTEEVWDRQIPFQIVAEVKDTVTGKVKNSILHQNILYLHNSTYEYYDWGNTYNVPSKIYFMDLGDVHTMNNKIVFFLNEISKDSYDADDEIIKFSRPITIRQGEWYILVQRNAYSDHIYVGGMDGRNEERYNPEFIEKAGWYRKDLFHTTLRRRRK
jgi:hypothetical protein